VWLLLDPIGYMLIESRETKQPVRGSTVPRGRHSHLRSEIVPMPRFGGVRHFALRPRRAAKCTPPDLITRGVRGLVHRAICSAAGTIAPDNDNGRRSQNSSGTIMGDHKASTAKKRSPGVTSAPELGGQ
jgi:hypothetical protein